MINGVNTNQFSTISSAKNNQTAVNNNIKEQSGLIVQQDSLQITTSNESLLPNLKNTFAKIKKSIAESSVLPTLIPIGTGAISGAAIMAGTGNVAAAMGALIGGAVGLAVSSICDLWSK